MLDHDKSPSAWAQAYVGLPYVLGTGECAHRAALVWRERFGIEVDLPPAFGDLRLAQRHVRKALSSGDWMPAARPAEGDAVVMWKGDLLCHVGVWVEPGHVLHCTRARGMTLDAVEDLPADGFRMQGCYRRRAVQDMALAA